MALITTAAREELIALFIGMFRAAPGATNLSQMVAAYESGATTAQIAANLATRSDFQTVYPTLQTAEEFAASLVATLLDSGVPAAAQAWATNWVVTNLQAGKSRAQVITEAVQAIRATSNTNYATAQAQLENKVEVATYYSVTQLQSSTSLAALQNVVATVTADDATVAPAKDVVDGIVAVNLGVTYNLTTSVDNITANAGNDIFNGQLGGTATLTGLDSLNGGAGSDTLNVFDVAGGAGLPGGNTIVGIETLNWNSVGAVTLNTTAFTDIKTLNVAQSTGAVGVTAGDGQDVTVLDTAGTVTVTGGASQTVTTAGGFVLSGSKGAVTVTDTAQAAVASSVNGGTDVTVTTTSTGTGNVAIGGTTAPTGAVTLNQTVNGNGAALTGGTIDVKGGTSQTITQTAQNTNGFTTTFGTVKADANGTATAVTVTQTPAQTAAATVAAVTPVKQVETVTFTALAAGATATVNGLTFTAGAAGTTAAQTAAAFANLATGDTQGASTLGTYSGSVTGAYSSGAASTATVTFTANVAGTAAGVAVAGGAGAPVVTVANVVEVKAAGKIGVVNSVVTLTDGGATDVLASATVSGYAAGSTITSDALTSLSLANSGTGTMAVTNTKATSLNLGLNNVKAGVDIGAVYTAVNATATGANSTFSLVAGGVTSLAVAGDKTLDISGAALGALKTVTVSGSAGLTLAAGEAATLTSVDSSATTGTTTVSIDGTKATFTGGAGVDKVTLTTNAPSKAISLAGGNDSVTFAAGTSSIATTITGGDGTDTATMDAADAAVLDGSGDFASKVTGFEVLGLTGATGAQTIDVAVLGFSQVSSAASAGTLTLDKVASGGSLTITGATAGTGYVVNVTDAATGTADSLNLVVTNAATIAAGTVTAANVEAINITSTDSLTKFDAVHTMTLVATAATSITVSGNAGLTLTNTGNTKVASIDGSTMTGALTVTAAGTTATTITGGAGNDALTASTGTKADVLIGGAGNDTLTGNAGLSTLTGGAGDDLFIAVASANVNSYVTITDGAAGDRIQLLDKGTETFQAAAISLGDTAVFQDYANAAINAGGDASTNGYIAWFQFSGNTYIVQSVHNATGTPDFQNGTDVIVRLTGLVDLSTASFNNGTVPILQIN